MKSTNVYMKLSGIIFIVLSAAFATSLQGQITQVGTATIASSVDWGSTTLTINKPSGISVGDIMIANISQTTDWQITPTVPAGTPTSDNWTQIATNNSGYNNIARGTLLYKIANATDADPATISYTFTLGANHKAAGAIVAFTGINKDNPFIAKDIGLMQLTPLSNNITCPGITTSADNAMVIMFATDWALCGTRDFNSWATAINPNPLTENYDYNSDVIPYVHIGAAWALKENAGPTGTGTLSNTNCSDIASRKTTAILLALRPERAVSITGPASICAANGTTTLIPTSGGTWESSNPSVASVTNAGDVTGLAAGTASFTFTADGGAWSATTEAVTVNPSFTPAVTIVSDLPGNKKCETQQYLLVKFTANTSNTGGGTVYYQWYWKGIPLSDWDISNTWESSELDDGEKVSCMIKVTGACLTSPTATSNEITTRVYPDVLPTVRIESDPGNEICDGANVIFTAIPENTNGGEVSYLWYLNGDPIGSYDKKTYYNNGESGNGDVVSCTITVTNGACFGTATATSDEITITVNPDGGTAATTTPTICPGKTAVITLTDYLGTIQWQYFNGTDIVDVVGGTGSTSSVYTTPPLNEDTYFFAKVTGGTCPPTSSNEVLITVNPAPENKSVTAKETQLCPGSITNVILQSSQTGVTYQLRNDNGDINIGDPVLGTGNDLELETGALNTTTTFNVFATSGDCSLEMADTPTVTVLDNTPASITDVTANLPAICNGSTSTLTVTGWLGGATAWNWFSGSCGGTLAGTGTSITVSPTETTIYYVRGEGGCATPGGTCSEVTVTVNPSPTLTSVSTPSWDVCVGSPIDVTASGLLNGTTQFEYAVTFVDSDDLTDDIITEVSVTKEVSGGEATFSIAVPAVGSYYIFVTSVT
ncbi:MAG: Ig-like domain-containing protein, partial [Bacteroidia bacterium]|nr:Ig-like domain-containing protein [Bacteroidia bacterium]